MKALVEAVRDQCQKQGGAGSYRGSHEHAPVGILDCQEDFFKPIKDLKVDSIPPKPVVLKPFRAIMDAQTEMCEFTENV